MNVYITPITRFYLEDGYPFLLFNGYLINPYIGFEQTVKPVNIQSKYVFPMGGMIFNKMYLKNVPLANEFQSIFKPIKNAFTGRMVNSSQHKIIDVKISNNTVGINRAVFINPKKNSILNYINNKLCDPKMVYDESCLTDDSNYKYRQKNKYIVDLLKSNSTNTTDTTFNYSNWMFSKPKTSTMITTNSSITPTQNVAIPDYTLRALTSEYDGSKKMPPTTVNKNINFGIKSHLDQMINNRITQGQATTSNYINDNLAGDEVHVMHIE